jgi:tetratricopeptide (TPR) repeat protein
MEQQSPMLRVLIVGDDPGMEQWVAHAVAQSKLPWKVRFTCPLRLNAPEYHLKSQDIIVLVWDRVMVGEIDTILNRVNIQKRSCEGAIGVLESALGEDGLKKVAVVSSRLGREDTVFLSEYNISCIQVLPEKQTGWEAEGPRFCQKLLKLHQDYQSGSSGAAEKKVQNFYGLLSHWEKVTDETKMRTMEDLLKTLGDTAQYSELIARKCLKEGNTKGAELWLKKSIQKNSSYLKSVRMLADLYYYTGNYSESLKLLERLKANNPRNFVRLTKMGRCYMAMGDYQKADKALEEALKIDEFYQPAREELGKVKVLLKDFDSARTLLSSCRNNKTLANFLNGIGIGLVDQGKFSESIDHYKKAQYVLPGNETSHLLFFNIGIAYAKWGKFTEANRYCRLALAREPNYERAQMLLKSITNKLNETLGDSGTYQRSA